MISNNEDETFRRLKKLTFEQFLSLCGKTPIVDLIKESGWTVDEYLIECNRRYSSPKAPMAPSTRRGGTEC